MVPMSSLRVRALEVIRLRRGASSLALVSAHKSIDARRPVFIRRCKVSIAPLLLVKNLPNSAAINVVFTTEIPGGSNGFDGIDPNTREIAGCCVSDLAAPSIGRLLFWPRLANADELGKA